MTSRYVYCPMASRKIGKRVTIADRFRRWKAKRRMPKPDVFPVTGFNAPVYPGK